MTHSDFDDLFEVHSTGSVNRIREVAGDAAKYIRDARRALRNQAKKGLAAKLLVELKPTNRVLQIWGLLLDYSDDGCGLVIVTKQALRPNQQCRITLPGQKTPPEATIIWIKNLGQNTYRLGLEYRKSSDE